MKNTILSIAILLGAVSTLLVSCKDENNCKAGTGGNVTIVAFPQHHGKTIYNQGNYPDTAYVKFNTQESPGLSPTDYDMIAVGDSGEDHVHIEGLKCGDYYIYMVGMDTTINERVKGGIPYSFSQESGEIDLTIPVSE
jgi:hypothetical protein